MKERIERRGSLSLSDALSEITRIEFQEQQRGRMDSERDQFNNIRMRLEAGVLTPQKALEQANDIANSRIEL